MIFTPGQAERAYAITEQYHPGLLENEFLYPNLGFISAEIFGDTDSDGVFNPGETSNLKVEIINYWGSDADSILATLSTMMKDWSSWIVLFSFLRPCLLEKV